MGSENSKNPNEVIRILAKTLSTQIYMIFCFNTKVSMFYKNSMFWINLLLELSKNLIANQNAGFFKLEYLTKKLRYEVEFLDVTRGP